MPIDFLEIKGLFVLTTAQTAYTFYLTDTGQLVHSYWGVKLPRLEDYPALVVNQQHSSPHSYRHSLLNEYPVINGIGETEPALRTLMNDGTRDLRLEYSSHTISDEYRLAIQLLDRIYGLAVVLEFQLYPDCDLIKRRVTLSNTSAQNIKLEQVLSASLVLPGDQGNFQLTQLNGAHLLETQLERQPVRTGRQVIEGRQLYTGHAANPFFALDSAGASGQGAIETGGQVWFGGLEWSGNWKIIVEQLRSPEKIVRVSAGINDFDFSWQLEPGEGFETPWLALGYTNKGFGQVSRNLHRYQLEHVLPKAFATKLRPVLYNSWEAVGFEVNETSQLDLAHKAARLGIELFVVDDGWFGQRHSDQAGLGDWWPNSDKFPQGLTPLIEQVNQLGMEFGLWVEPEMVNPDSELYRAHPDWVYHFPSRESSLSRYQLILNLARDEVKEFVFSTLDRLLGEHNIKYLKWDYNRPVSEAGWPDALPERQREVAVRHVWAFYEIVARLRENHPGVLLEVCASGGGRVDMGSLHYFDHAWASDNTDPLDRLAIQQGYTLAYAPKTMYAWVTQSDHNQANYSLRYRFHSAMLGSLGIGANLNHWNEAELEEAGSLIAEYKAIRSIVQHGQMYRLTHFGEVANQAVQYQTADGSAGIVLAFGRREHFWHNRTRLHLQNLQSDQLYQLSGDLAEGYPGYLSGQGLMEYGLLPQLGHALYSSALVKYNIVK